MADQTSSDGTATPIYEEYLRAVRAMRMRRWSYGRRMGKTNLTRVLAGLPDADTVGRAEQLSLLFFSLLKAPNVNPDDNKKYRGICDKIVIWELEGLLNPQDSADMLRLVHKGFDVGLFGDCPHYRERGGYYWEPRDWAPRKMALRKLILKIRTDPQWIL